MAVTAATLGLIAAAASLDQAWGGNFSFCNGISDHAEFAFDQPGSSVKMAVGYADTGATNDQIGNRYKAKDAEGEKTSGSSSCGNDAGDTWLTLEVLLGDRADELRLDARKPKPAGLDDPLPDFVDATLHGGKGPDVIRGHKGYDEVYGEQGDDKIRVDGGGADFVDCGPGNDKVYVNASDNTVNCEKIR